jgi:hypothetical protein
MSDQIPPIASAPCPVCGAPDAFIDTLRSGDEYYVECLNCKVYRASRRAFRLFEYLRWRGDPDGLARLKRLATALNARGGSGASRLEYDTWDELGSPRENEA